MKNELALCGKRKRKGSVTGPKKCTKTYIFLNIFAIMINVKI